MTAWAVLKTAGGHQAFKVEISASGEITKTQLCEPCVESLAYSYLRARMDDAWLQRMIDNAKRTGR